MRRFTLAALTSALLAACGGAPIPEAEPPPVRYTYALSVDITPQDNRAEIEALHGGSALIWHPEAGFAVLGVEELAPQNTRTQLENNRDVFSVPSVNAQGRSAWAGGRSAWAGGWNAWAGGTDAAALTTLRGNLAAWQQIRLAQGQALISNQGRGIKVAVIDSGVDVDHPALQGKLAPENEWRDFIDGDGLPLDEKANAGASNEGYGHGTGVAGVILQVAPEATILPLRVLKPDGSGDLTDVAMAIDWAAKQGAEVINLSLGATGDTNSKAIAAVLAYAQQRYGVYVAVSSGNTGADRVTYPASLAKRANHDHLISVGSVDAQNVRSLFSTYGPDISLYAPGEEVYTLMPERGVGHRTGTSFAAPIVAGTLALALSDFGTDTPYTQALLSSANYEVDSRDPTPTGVLDVERFLSFEDVDEVRPTVTFDSLGELTLGESVTLTGDVADNLSVSTLELYEGATLLGEATLTGSTWSYLYTPRLAGTFTLKALASDAAGNSGAASLTVTVAQPVVWPVQFGSARYDEAEGVTTDAEGNVYLVGKTYGSLASPNAGGRDAFVVKLDKRGAQVWVEQFGSGGDDEAESVTVDAAGNVYVTGHTYGSLEGSNAGNSDFFLARYSSSGDQAWMKQFGSAGHDEADSVTVDAAGDLYITGHTYGSLAGANAGGLDAFLAKYDSEGNQVWIQQLGSATNEEAKSVTADAAGNVYITGYTDNVLAGTSAGGFDIFLAKYGSNGIQVWLKQFGTDVDDEGMGVITGTDGHIYVTGYTRGSLAVDNAGNSDVFLAKYDAQGAQVWLEQFGSASDEYVEGIAGDAAGNLYLAGHTYGNTAGSNRGGADVLVAKYDAQGAQVWVKQSGSAAADEAESVSTDAAGNVYLTGYTEGALAGTNAGSGDVFVIKYGNDGVEQ